MNCIYKNKLSIGFFILSLVVANLSWAQTPRRFDLDFKQVKIKSLLHKISQFTDVNIVISPDIKGQMALHLKQVTGRQALKVVVASQHLEKRRINDVIYIKPHSKEPSSESNHNQACIVHLNYAKACQMAQLLSRQVESSNNLNEVTADKRTNSLIVDGTDQGINRVKRLIKQLDQPSPQVMVNARIVSVDQSYRQQLGVRFGLQKTHSVSSGSTSNAKQNQKLHADLPNVSGASSYTGIAMFKVAKDVIIDTELSALATEGHANIISNPKLVASNHKSAQIEAGRKIPFQEKTGEGSTTATFKKAVLKLKVTPQVVRGDQLLLHLTVSQDTQGSERVLGVPTINTRQINTNVLVNDQRTIVLGGIYEQTQQHNVEKVPFVSELPVVGKLFQYHDNKNSKRQLMIFVTPKLLKS